MGKDKTPTHVDEFYIGKYPVTNTQYAAFSKDRKIPSGKADHPVASVTWNQAVRFCDWLSKETGRKFRLPTEEEWEKAARGGLEIPGADGRLIDNPELGRKYPWGDQPPTKDNGRCNFRGSGIGDTTPVGLYPIGGSPYGVRDMAGNLWEWTDSLWEKGSDRRVWRGGSYVNDAWYARCAVRVSDSVNLLAAGIGFRVVVASAHHS